MKAEPENKLTPQGEQSGYRSSGWDQFAGKCPLCGPDSPWIDLRERLGLCERHWSESEARRTARLHRECDLLRLYTKQTGDKRGTQRAARLEWEESELRAGRAAHLRTIPERWPWYAAFKKWLEGNPDTQEEDDDPLSFP